MSRQARKSRRSKEYKKFKNKMKQQRKDAVKDINKRISKKQRQLKQEKNPEEREKLKNKIEGLERQKKMCVAKRRFETDTEARIFSLNKDFDCNLRPYRCPYCHGFHLTSKWN